jgi:predicted membrane protein
MRKRNIFWGIFFIAATILLIASQLGSFMEIGFWSLLGTILLIAIIIQSCMYRMFLGIFLPVALIYLIFQQPLGWPHFSLWILVIASILLSIGFHIIFRKRPNYGNGCNNPHSSGRHGGWKPNEQVDENGDDNHPSVFVKFGNVTRYLHADCFESGRFQCSFGNLEVYFSESTLSPNGAEAFVDSSFGSVKLYVPRGWEILNRTNASMGELRFTGSPRLSENPPQLIINGNISMGDIQVIYI